LESNTPNREKIAFIINPISGSNRKLKIPEIVQETLDQSKFDAEFYFTKCAGHATQLATEMLEKNYSRIIAVGGDGTINEVAKALVDSNAAMGIIPKGSGNGLARFLKIPLKVKDAVELLNRGKIMSIDYGTINDNPFFCTCGVGFDAHIGSKFAESDKRGFTTYVKETVRAFFTYKPKKYKINVDGEKLKTRAFLVTAANAGQYGNDAYIAPQADIQDGLLDLCILSPFPKRKVFNIAYRVFNKSINRSEYVRAIKGEEITIKRKKKGEVHLDGEPAIMGKKLKIRIVKHGLKVVVENN
jgi:YegS/Rv2252/BmrU family lipid kinase